ASNHTRACGHETSRKYQVGRVDGDETPIRWARGGDDVRGALRVREQVFCKEQGVPLTEEIDSHDDEALHLVALDPSEQRVIATLRLLVDARSAKIGRVAVERAWRRRGIASHMLALALIGAREHGCVTARLAAQTEAITL